jgi:hypothetical protein
MALDNARELRALIDAELPALRAFAGTAPATLREGAWSPKEELGHLIDSAANNHVRFVRATLEPSFSGQQYDQEGWVRLHGYRDLPWSTLVDFWYGYNSLLAQLVDQIPEERHAAPCTIGSNAPVTLRFLIEDYALHMRHHLDHLLGRAVVTRYPA